jgi:hypothetical protein
MVRGFVRGGYAYLFAPSKSSTPMSAPHNPHPTTHTPHVTPHTTPNGAGFLIVLASLIASGVIGSSKAADEN